jgi:hypothetical protein
LQLQFNATGNGGTPIPKKPGLSMVAQNLSSTETALCKGEGVFGGRTIGLSFRIKGNRFP